MAPAALIAQYRFVKSQHSNALMLFLLNGSSAGGKPACLGLDKILILADQLVGGLTVLLGGGYLLNQLVFLLGGHKKPLLSPF